MWHVNAGCQWPTDQMVLDMDHRGKFKLCKKWKFRNHLHIRVRVESCAGENMRNYRISANRKERWEDEKMEKWKLLKAINQYESLNGVHFVKKHHALKRTEERKNRQRITPSLSIYHCPHSPHSVHVFIRHVCVCGEYFPLVSDSIKWNFKFEMDTTCERRYVFRFRPRFLLCVRGSRAYREPNRERTINSIRKTENRTICYTLVFWKIEELPFFTNSVTCAAHHAIERQLCYALWTMVCVHGVLWQVKILHYLWFSLPARSAIVFRFVLRRRFFASLSLSLCPRNHLRHMALRTRPVCDSVRLYGVQLRRINQPLQSDANIHGHE